MPGSAIPTDDRVSLAVSHGCDFVRRLRTKRDQRSGFRNDAKLRVFRLHSAKIREDKRSAAVNIRCGRVAFTIEEGHCRNASLLGVETKQPGVAVLMGHKEVADLVSQKLRVLTLTQPHAKMFANRSHARTQTFEHQC